MDSHLCVAMTVGVSGAWGCVNKGEGYSEIDKSTTNHAASELWVGLWVVWGYFANMLTLDSWLRHLANHFRHILQ